MKHSLQLKTLEGLDLEILPRCWYKRREPNKQDGDIVGISMPDFKQEHNHLFDIYVEYADGTSKKYTGRTVYNEINDYWTVDGMFVAMKLL